MRSPGDPTPQRSVLRDSIPDDWTPAPPEVTGALWPLEAGGPWEGGTTDRTGQRWTHVPWQGWQPTRPPMLRTHDGRVYQSREVSRAFRRGRRRRRWARVRERAAGPALIALAGGLVAAGVAVWSPWPALAGILVGAASFGWSVGR